MNPRLVVVWRVTDRCNLSCGFCAHDKRLDIARKDIDLERVLRFGAVLARYRLETGTGVHLSFLGGEPCLWPGLQRAEQELSRLGLSLGITTNGTTLHSAAMRRRLHTYYDELTLSVDGVGETHDNLRGHSGGYGKLAAAVTQLAQERLALRAPGARTALKIRVNSVLMRHTIAEFEALCAELAEWGVDEITFNELGGRDRPEFFPENRLQAEQVDVFRRRFLTLQSRLAARGVHLQGTEKYLRRIQASTLGVAWPVQDCDPGRRFLFIDTEGRISPCNYATADYAVPVDEVDSVPALLDLHRRFAWLQRERRAAACDDCRSTQVSAKYSQGLVQLGRGKEHAGAA